MLLLRCPCVGLRGGHLGCGGRGGSGRLLSLGPGDPFDTAYPGLEV